MAQTDPWAQNNEWEGMADPRRVGGRRDNRGDHRGHGQGRAAHWNAWREGNRQRAGHQMHDARTLNMPNWMVRVPTGAFSDQSTMIQDTRDRRVISPYQCWSVPEIMDNSAGTINVMTERDQILAPSRGYFFTLHGVYTVSQFKCTVNLQFDIPTSVPCAA